MTVAALIFADQIMGAASGLKVGHERPCQKIDANTGMRLPVQGF
jgi:hypothetical protein